MRYVVLSLSLGILGTCPGCGGESVTPALLPTSNLHGGILVPLSDNGGYVELLNEGGERKAGANETRIVAYVLQPDQKTAIAPPPTSVAVKLTLKNGPRTIPLNPSPTQDDPVGNARFASDPGPLELNQIGGEATVAVGGKTLNGAFRGQR